MRKSRSTEEQMVKVLREADRTSVAEAAKKHLAESHPAIEVMKEVAAKKW